jgi:hypothetical protein
VRETLSPEETRDAFADLRAALLPEVKAPGPGAARRALRRRRRMISAAAGVAVVAVAGGVAAALAGGPAPAPPPSVVAEPAPVTPSLDVPAAAEGGRLRSITRAALDEPYSLTTTTVAKGVQRYVVVCSGKGSGTATLTAAGKTATGTVTCATPPATSTIELDVTAAGADLTLRIEWAPGHELRDTADGWAIGVWTLQRD